MTATVMDAAVRGMALAALVGLGLGALRVTNVPARKAAWTLVLVASAGMPLLLGWPAFAGMTGRWAWVVPLGRSVAKRVASEEARPGVAIPVETTEEPAVGAAEDAGPRAAALPMADVAAAAEAPREAAAGAASAGTGQRARRWPPLQRVVVWVYLAVAGALMLRLLWGVGAAWWLWSQAEEVSPLTAPEPNVRVSAKIPSPVTIGSGIVLPAQYVEWDRAKLRVVLAHERSHVRQGDFYLQLLAGLYTAAFWFSPLGWWLNRTLAGLSEAISDRAGIEAAPSRTEYAGVLLEFAAATRRALPGVAMARSGNLSQRVEQMLDEKRFRRAFAEGRRRAILSLLLVPAALFAVTALVRVPSAAAQERTGQNAGGPANPAEDWATVAVAPAEEAPAAVAPVAPVADEQQAPGVPVNPPDQAEPGPQGTPVPPPQAAPAPAPHPKAAPPDVLQDGEGPMVLDAGPMPEVWAKMPDMKIVMPKMPDFQALTVSNLGNVMELVGPGDNFYLAPNGGVHGYAYYFSSNGGDSWAIVDGAGQHFSMGDGAAKGQIDLAQRMAKGPFLWFTHEGKSYIVDDAAIVARIRGLYDPMKELGRRQSDLGVQQSVLGRMEGELARQQQTDANVRVPDLSKQMAAAQAALENLKSQQGQMMSQEKLAEMERKLADVERQLGKAQAKAAMQNNFGEKMRALGEQQQQLGEQQRQLGEQQKKLAEQAQQQVESIIRECLQNGKAAPVSK